MKQRRRPSASSANSPHGVELAHRAIGRVAWAGGFALAVAAGCASQRNYAPTSNLPVTEAWFPAAATSESPQRLVRAQDPGPNYSQAPTLPPGTTVYSNDPYATTLRPPTPQTPTNPAPTFAAPAGQPPATGFPQEGGVVQQPVGPTNLNPTPLPQVGDPNAISPLPGPAQFGVGQNYFDNTADLDIYVQESMTGRVMIGGAYNSDAGLTGQITIDERNFDLWRFPTSWSDLTEGRAFRGAGQGFRLELLPGNQVQRYMVSFTEPYLLNSLISFNGSGYYYTRNFFDWNEQRLGGQVSLGYRLTPELSISGGTRLENVKVFDPRVDTSTELNDAVGSHNLYLGFLRLVNDTRDHPFLATEGAYFEAAFHQAFGDYSYPRADLDYRRYFLVYQRPDASGRHTVSYGTKLGYTGSDTPVFENYFAGGFSTMRGYSFRGASPVQGGVRVGGEFQWLNSLEYMFPLTADDMVRGVVFCDFGTVEEDVRLDMDNFRVAPGFGFRVHMPAAGAGGAPLAFDFAFPVLSADSDDTQMFSFYMSVNR